MFKYEHCSLLQIAVHLHQQFSPEFSMSIYKDNVLLMFYAFYCKTFHPRFLDNIFNNYFCGSKFLTLHPCLTQNTSNFATGLFKYKRFSSGKKFPRGFTTRIKCVSRETYAKFQRLTNPYIASLQG